MLQEVKGEYKPRYISCYGKEVEMEKNSAVMETLIGQRVLTYNPESAKGCVIAAGPGMKRSSIPELRAAIYQVGDSTEEQRKIKEEIIQTLEEKEEKLVNDFLNWEPLFQRIEDSTK